jgi:hypothetical protein
MEADSSAFSLGKLPVNSAFQAFIGISIAIGVAIAIGIGAD